MKGEMEEKKEKAEGETYGDQDDLIESNNLSAKWYIWLNIL